MFVSMSLWWWDTNWCVFFWTFWLSVFVWLLQYKKKYFFLSLLLTMFECWQYAGNTSVKNLNYLMYLWVVTMFKKKKKKKVFGSSTSGSNVHALAKQAEQRDNTADREYRSITKKSHGVANKRVPSRQGSFLLRFSIYTFVFITSCYFR